MPMHPNLVSPGGKIPTSRIGRRFGGREGVRWGFRATYAKEQRKKRDWSSAPGMKQQSNRTDAILFLPTGAVVDIWSHWLPSCLVPSSVPDGRHDLNLMVAPLYSLTLSSGCPGQLKFFSSRHGCSRCLPLLPTLPPPVTVLVSFSISSFSRSPAFSLFLPVIFSLSPPVIFSPSRLFVVSRCPTRYAPAIKSACSPRTFTWSLTPGSAGVKGTDVLA